MNANSVSCPPDSIPAGPRFQRPRKGFTGRGIICIIEATQAVKLELANKTRRLLGVD